MKLWSVAVLAGAALIGIVGASYWSVAAVAVMTGLLAVVMGIGWPHLLDVPAKKTQGAVLALAGAGACAAAFVAPAAALLTWLPGIAAVGVGAIFLIQLLRGTGQAHRLESTIGNIAGVLLAVMGSGWVAADRLAGTDGSPAGLTMAAAGIVAALAASLIPVPDRIAAPLGVAAGALAGALAGVLQPEADVPALSAALMGAVGAAVIMAVRRLVLSRDITTRRGRLALALAPILALGSVVYFLARLLVP
ncbi:hypothetical protein QNO08_14100 [Arthrobacter sp. zg-Y820]|uniref:hypothetical protein n=1 Tax=unclassified Arthrobacter TaxID=235627 RepID=UPI001E4A7965|nr:MULTISPECIES: hypothetical protein [unclassified Arthrobacter]MCC9195758.1 hypothetical protein [Arthrobacter sp. zg-Y820]MDK1278617.1 hypothetical protein [Arthrobacter sp. zg.Y820]MDK1359785.1 hypothetical protein [Arthrobacter sp. zg-Y1219]WIB08952.1 hypothetical protein QNO08_14100 [Arthrobacter sp. zg-Y820]